jgi:hypothetical protein
MSGKKKRKLNKNAVIAGAAVGAVVLIGAIVLIVRGVTGSSKNTDSNVNVSNAGVIVNSQYETEAATLDSKRVDTTVEIQIDDFSAVIGTKLQVVALVTPAGTEQSVVWKSSNDAVFTVTSDGVVEVTGKGTAVLSATAGTVSDSIVIEGIESMASGSSNDLPVYTGTSGSGYYYSGNGTSTGTDVTYNNTSNDSNVTGGNAEQGTVASQEQQTQQPSAGEQESQTDAGENAGEVETQPIIIDGNQYNVTEIPTGGNGGYDSTTVGEILPDSGFEQVMSNVYTYEENGKYCGEIVTQPNVTIIYIKERNDSFDDTVKSVIASMMPESAAQVWNTYETANTNKTFIADNKMVRIVVPEDGGQTQIVIYN